MLEISLVLMKLVSFDRTISEPSQPDVLDELTISKNVESHQQQVNI